MMRGRQVGVWAMLAIGVGAIACEQITQVGNFQVDQSLGYQGFCNACPSSTAKLKHPPCPVESSAPDDGQVYVYAWRTIHFGVSADPTKTLDPAAYDTGVGYNQDCSDRQPSGLPVLCKPNFVDGGVPWQAYPEGIDNALTQRMLGPLVVGAAQRGLNENLEQGIDDNFAKGGGGVLDIVYNWNGTPNDPKVSFRVVASIGTVNAAIPKWDGSDEWIGGADRPDPNLGQFEIPDINFATDSAYISNGVLFADLSFLDPAAADVFNGKAALTVYLHNFKFIGTITQTSITDMGAVALWSLDDALRAVPDLAGFLVACDPILTDVLENDLPPLITGAADMPLDPTAGPDQPCNAMSVTWAGSGTRAHIGKYQDADTIAGCPQSP
jgi:hypothetical protein